MRHFVEISTLCLSFICLVASSALALDQAIVEVYLNTELKGTYFGYMVGDQEFLLAREDLLELGLDVDGKERVLDDTTYISLNSLAPEVTYQLNAKDVSLYITAIPDIFDKTTIDLKRAPPKDISVLSDDSGFLNYSLSYNADDDLKFANLALPFEIGVRWKDQLYYSNFSYYYSENENEFTRLFSYIIHDDPDNMLRYTFGDFNTGTGELGGGATLAGLNFSRNFNLDPYFLRYPNLNLVGQLQTPSDVEIWRNGTLLETKTLGPGDFEFMNVPASTGAGEAEVVIRDAYGQEQRINYPFYFSNRLLRKGLHEYDYSLGLQREKLGVENFSYSDPVFAMYHRYGFCDWLSAGIRGEANNDLANVGFTGTFKVKHYGAINFAGAFSDYRGRNGHAFSVGASFSEKSRFSGNLTLRTQSRGYSNLSILPQDDKAKTNFLASLFLNLQPYGTLSAFYTSVDKYVDDDIERITLRYSKNLTRRLRMELSASRIMTDTTSDEIYVTLSYSFGKGVSVNASAGRSDERNSQSITVQKSSLSRLGTSYRLQANKTEDDNGDDSQSYVAEATKTSTFGRLNARVFSSDNIENYSLRVSGSVSVVKGSFHLGPSIHDAFAVVKVGQIEDVEVSQSNSPVGRTNDNGEVLVPYMLSNYANKISFNEDDIPLEYEYGANERHISLPYRGGAYFEFDVKKFQSVIGRLFIREDQKTRPAEFWRMDLSVDSVTLEAPVGRGGEFYLENLSSGRYSATLVKGDTKCSLNLDVPESDEVLNDLGDIYCELD